MRLFRPGSLGLVLFSAASLAPTLAFASSSIPARFKPEPQEQFVSYWTAEPGWHTDLMLRIIWKRRRWRLRRRCGWKTASRLRSRRCRFRH